MANEWRIVALENHQYFFLLWFIDPKAISQAKSQTSSDKMSQLPQQGDAVIAQRDQDETMSLVLSTVQAKALLVPVICPSAMKSA